MSAKAYRINTKPAVRKRWWRWGRYANNELDRAVAKERLQMALVSCEIEKARANCKALLISKGVRS